MSYRWRSLHTRRKLAWLAALAIALLLGSGAARAADGLGLDWWTIDGGGAVGSTSGDLTLSGTIGQPDAAAPAHSGELTLAGGFWFGEAAEQSITSRLYLPLVTHVSKTDLSIHSIDALH